MLMLDRFSCSQSMSKDSDEVERFRTVVYDRLKGELAEAQKHQKDIHRELQEYAALLVVVRNLQNNSAEKINIRTSLGHQVFVNAELAKRDTVIVKLGGDLFAELTLPRAEIFIVEKLEILKKKSAVCLELLSKIRATMKFIMAAVAEYDKLTIKQS
ncbi:hypothetical protein KIN20_009346 [Parelaphostrongylus tenuis]|uniref:Prefoldin subunit n=1 Tax=Parelaphostrongylus tenuis TaxID=148309 RepID=A0AAD5M673_PARTN|nr:hypothetical protein KIN20_009346 [Parelaphostrongylus tenuis]